MGRPSKIEISSTKYPDAIENLRTDYVSQTDTGSQSLQGGSLNWLDRINAIPIHLPFSTSATTTYENGYIKTVGKTGQYGAIKTGQSIHHLYVLEAYATLKVDLPANLYPFFFEPHKGNYANFQGYRTTSTPFYYATSRNNSVETSTQLSNQDYTKDTKFSISHYADQSACDFQIDGAEVAHHTTNISAQPYEICCCEPTGVVRTFYLKYPPGIAIGPGYGM